MGYQRRVDGEVINPANGFAFGFTNAEHFLCKGWIMIKKTFHHYRNSLYPNPTEPHYHPLRMLENDRGRNFFQEKWWDEWFDRIVKAFFETAVNEEIGKRTVLPEVFQVQEMQ
jgi:hypothetical protein